MPAAAAPSVETPLDERGHDAAAAGASALERPFAASPAEVAAALGTDLECGLATDDASRRLVQYGPNAPERERRPPYLRLALNQLLDPLVLLLVAAAAVSIAIGDVTEGVAIAAILVLNGILGFWQEAGAERAILALSQAFTRTALVIRDGATREVPGEDVVPGDLLVLRAGDRVAADGRLVEASGLETDESALTGESLPVAKRIDAVEPSAPLAERFTMVFAGTAVTQGGGRALVCAHRHEHRDGSDRGAGRAREGADNAAHQAPRAARPPDGRARRGDHPRARRRDPPSRRRVGGRVPDLGRRRRRRRPRRSRRDRHGRARVRRAGDGTSRRDRAPARRDRDTR